MPAGFPVCSKGDTSYCPPQSNPEKKHHPYCGITANVTVILIGDAANVYRLVDVAPTGNTLYKI
jgi:hypothetical protein